MDSDALIKTVRVSKHLLKAIRRRAKAEDVDESTAIRQLIAIGAKNYAVDMYKAGKITLNDTSDLAGITIREMIDLVLECGVRGNVRLDQHRKAIDYAIKG